MLARVDRAAKHAGGRPPKPGSPQTMERRAKAAQKKQHQMERRTAGESWPRGRPRKADDDGSPKRVAKRLKWRATHEKPMLMEDEEHEAEEGLQHLPDPEAEPPSTPPRPAAANSEDVSPPSTRSRSCIICFESCTNSFMPCGARVHKHCLQAQMNANLTGSKLAAPRATTTNQARESAWKDVRMQTTHQCPACRTDFGSARVLVREEPPPGSRC